MNCDQQQCFVSFNNAVRCMKSLHINDYAEDEVANTWYSREEYTEIKRDIRATVSVMRQNSRLPQDADLSTWGLEDRMPDRIARKARNRFLALAAVLDEQDRQRELGICDAVAISHVYKASSTSQLASTSTAAEGARTISRISRAPSIQIKVSARERKSSKACPKFLAAPLRRLSGAVA